MREITFRDYQHEAIESAKKNFKQGKNKQLIVLPTGAGKTVVFSGMAKWMLEQGKRVLVMAHRQELIDQAREKISWVIGDSYTTSVEMAEERADDSSHVVVASVATLGRTQGDDVSKRLARFDPSEFGLMIIDEAHHATSQSYRTVVDHFTGGRKDILLLGVTATPNRTDEESLAEVFETVVYQKTMLDMAREKWLTPVVSYRISSKTDLGKVKTVAGDYNLRDLAQAVNNLERNTLIIETYLKKFRGQQGLVFATDLEHVFRLTDQFNHVGVKAAAISGDMDKEVRRTTIEAFKNKELDIVVNYGCLTEGFDYEELSVIILARPTQSSLLLTQMVGRGNRLSPGKLKCEVIEIVDYHSEKTVTVASLFKFKKEYDCESHDFLECFDTAKDLQQEFPEFNPFFTKSWTEMLARYEHLVEAKNRKAAKASEAPPADRSDEPKDGREDIYFDEIMDSDFFENRYRFTFYGVDKLKLRFDRREEDNKQAAFIVKDALGNWCYVIKQKPRDTPSWDKEAETTVCSGKEKHMLDAVKAVELHIMSNFRDHDVLLNTKAAWRKRHEFEPCTDRQYEIIQQNKLSKRPRPQINKLYANDLLKIFFDRLAAF